jgi:hypothetical protein
MRIEKQQRTIGATGYGNRREIELVFQSIGTAQRTADKRPRRRFNNVLMHRS